MAAQAGPSMSFVPSACSDERRIARKRRDCSCISSSRSKSRRPLTACPWYFTHSGRISSP